MLHVFTYKYIINYIPTSYGYEYLFKLLKVNKIIRNILESISYCTMFKNNMVINFKKILKTFKNITTIKLCYDTYESGILVTDKYLKYINKFKNIKRLYILNIHKITDKGLKNIKNIKFIHLSNCNKITNKGIEYLQKNKNIKIRIFGCKYIIFNKIKSFKNIENIDIYNGIHGYT